VEKIEFDPLLIQTQEYRLVVEIRLHTVDGLGSVGTKTSCWGERNGLLVIQLSVRVVDESCWVGWEHWNCGSHWRVTDGSYRGRSAGERSVTGDTSNLTTNTI